MPLLAPTQNPANAMPEEMRIRSEVNQIKAAPRRLAEQLIKQWEHTFDALWTESNGVTPAKRIEALGPNAAELFAINAALVQFLVSTLAGQDDAMVARIMAKVAVIPEHMINEDGTVTLL